MMLCIFEGNLGNDPKQGTTTKGTEFSNFSMAVKDDNREQEPTWIQFVAYNNVAKIINQYCKKGHELLVRDCKPRKREFTDKNGVEHVEFEFIVNKIKFRNNRGKEVELSTDDLPFEPSGSPSEEAEKIRI